MPNFLHFADINSLQLRCKFNLIIFINQEKCVAKANLRLYGFLIVNLLFFNPLHSCNTIAERILRRQTSAYGLINTLIINSRPRM